MRKTTAKALLILLCTIICLFPAALQADGSEWSNLSPAALPEDHMLTDDGFTLNVSGGIPYVLTNKALATVRSMRVYKGENGYWPAIGEALTLGNNESFISSDVYDGQVYIAYMTRGTSGYVPIVKKLDSTGGSWSTVGDLGGVQLRDITSYDNISIKLYNGIPYIAFIASPTSIKVMRYEEGSWVSVGQALTESGYYINNVKLQFDGDVPYVAWKKIRYQYSYQQINIARYQNGQWSMLPDNDGNIITTIAETDLDFCFDNGNVYLAYQDNTLNRNPSINYEQTYVAPNRASGGMFNNVVVWRHNGTKWEKLPETYIGCYLGYNCCIEAKNGRLYAASNGGGVWANDSQTGKWTKLAPVSSAMWTVDLKCEGDRLFLAFGSHDQKVIVRSLDLLQQPAIVTGAANTSAPATPAAPAAPAGTTSGTAPQAQNSPDWDGVWSTKNGTMMLQQSGSDVWGIYGTNENDSYTFKGTANGSKLTGTFEDGSGKNSGIFEFTLSKDGGLAGRYKDNNALEWIYISGTEM